MSHDSHSAGTDMKAAFVGLIGGAIFVLIVATTIVKLTNAHYAGEKAGTEQGR